MMVRLNLDNTTAADNVLGIISQSRRAGTERYQYTPYGQRTTYTHGWIRADLNDDGEVGIADWDLFGVAYSGSPDPDDRSDLDGNGEVDNVDLDIIGTQQWGDSLPANDPSVMHPKYRSFRNMDGYGNTQATALCEFGHQGLMHDEEFMVTGQAGSQLIYNRARTLHPGLGRFMQRDPLGYIDGMSLYEYVKSNPFANRDPNGTALGDPPTLNDVIPIIIGPIKKGAYSSLKSALANCPTLGLGACKQMSVSNSVTCPTGGEIRISFQVYEDDGLGYINADLLFSIVEWKSCTPGVPVSIDVQFELCCDEDRNLTGGKYGRGRSGDIFGHEVFWVMSLQKDRVDYPTGGLYGPSDPATSFIYDETSGSSCIKCACKSTP